MDTCIFRIKKCITVILTTFLLICYSSCGNSESSNEIGFESDDISTGFVETSDEYLSAEENSECDELKIPYASICGNSVWDLKLFENCLYIGAGDYDKNYTVGVAYRYNLSLEEWEQCGVIPDEQISRFLEIDNTLFLPGIDPTESWSFGNYYVLENGSFVTKRDIPGGIHCFDIVDFEGKYFFGVGVLSDSYPVLTLDAESGEYEQIPIRNKQGEIADMTEYADKLIRAYDLVVLNNSLYALIELGNDISFYKFENSEFVYFSAYSKKISNYRLGYTAILEKKIWNNSLYFTNGRLYHTDDMKSIKDKTPENVKWIIDILVKDNRMFLLGSVPKDDGRYLVKILEMKNDSFTTISEFETEYSPQAFEYDGTRFYIATGDKDAASRIDNDIKIISYAN